MTNTNFICTGMIMFNNSDSKLKAIAQVSVNGEFVIAGIRVYEGANGPFASMPSKLVDGEYRDVIFPITKQARFKLFDSVIRTYNNMRMSGMERMPLSNPIPAPAVPSDVFVTLNKGSGNVKAVGQAVINNSIVITDIRVCGYKDADSKEERLFVAMPSYKTGSNEYKNLAFPTSPAFKEKLNNAVMAAYGKILETEYFGLSYNDLRKGGDVSKIGVTSKDFARKFSAELGEVGIPYSAQINDRSAIYVLKQDEDIVTEVRKMLTKKLVETAA